MEQIAVWIGGICTILTVIILPLFNALITKKIDTLDDNQKKDRELFFKKLDDDRLNVESHYVRLDLYNQAQVHALSSSDEKFRSLLSLINTQFSNFEGKLGHINSKLDEKMKDMKELEEKIDDMSDLINAKFNGNK